MNLAPGEIGDDAHNYAWAEVYRALREKPARRAGHDEEISKWPLFPLTSNFEGDFVLQLVAVDTENTMDEVAAAAVHSVGRRVRARPGHILRVRRQGAPSFCRAP
jgi:hypothetical protein